MTVKSGEDCYSSSVVHGVSNPSRFATTSPFAIAETTACPRPCDVSLTPQPSPLCPHCLARDQLHLWLPHITRSRLDHTGSLVRISNSDIDRIITVLSHSHAPSMWETYGSGLLVFHMFCNVHAIPEDQRCPASLVLILAFIAACSGLYSGKSLENYFYAIQAWHLLHSQAWLVNNNQCSLAISGSKHLAPITSKWPKHAPFTVDILVAIRSMLDLSSPLHAAVYACLTTSFYTIARIREFTVPSLLNFNLQHYIRVCNWHFDVDRHGFRVTIFHLPRMKTSLLGEDVYWATQSGQSNPEAALLNHLSVNKLASTTALFSWCHCTGMHPLTRNEFIKCLQSSSDHLGLGSLKAHGLRIGGTLEYLLQGVPFENVKTMGRWSSDTLVLFLQDKPVLEPFMCYALPPPL
ncbi:hypothetical protein BDR06DRAFT_1027868 [Suillus hirtellus]|nr:hypothetical protein BDR06DRAFT_1027868 [Suillus hirtellus]